MALKDFTKEKYDIIIQAGQSNSDGSAWGDIDPADEYKPRPEVWHMTQDFYIELARELAAGNTVRSHYGLQFANAYINAGMLDEGRKILILRTSVGGTGFLDNHWKLTDDHYLRMIEMTRTALEINPENRLVALLWHQGENDATLKASYDVHYNNLSTLLNSVRKEFGVPNLPFVAGNFVQKWREDNAEICEPVIKAIRAVCDEENAAFVETDGLKSNAQDETNPLYEGVDTIHFCRSAINELGKRYFAAYEKIVKK